MNKKELVNFVAENTEMTKKDSKVVIDAVLDGILDGLVADGKVSLTNFGSFSVTERAARKGRNPHTGDELDIPSKFAPKFRPSKNMKERVADEGVLPSNGKEKEDSE